MNIEKINKIQTTQQAVNYIKFSKENNFNPRDNSKNKKEKQLYTWYVDFIGNKDNIEKYPEIFEKLEKNTFKEVEQTYNISSIQEENMKNYVRWVKEHDGKIPNVNADDEEEKKLARWKYRLPTVDDGNMITDILKKELGIKDYEDDVTEMVDVYIKWCEENNRIPAGHRAETEEEKTLAKWFSKFKIRSKYKKYHNDAKKIQDFLEKFYEENLINFGEY